MRNKLISKISTSNNFLMRYIANAVLRKLANDSQSLIMKGQNKDVDILKLIHKIRGEVALGVLNTEAYQIYQCAKSCKNLEGDYAECGFWQGGTAKLICEAVKDAGKEIHLFDSFTGIGEKSEYDSLLEKGQFTFSSEKVVSYLAEYKQAVIHVGEIPSLFSSVEKEKKFAFVHLDLDYYKPTLEALKFFYNRVVPNGIILIHDYNTCLGIQKAINDFKETTELQVYELSTNQCIIVK